MVQPLEQDVAALRREIPLTNFVIAWKNYTYE
jgi:hypothetical protein